MPSPIAHLATGHVIHRIYRRRLSQAGPEHSGRVPVPMLGILALSMMPDADSVAGFVAGDLGKFHNGWTHSLVVAVGVSVAIGLGLALFSNRATVIEWFLIALLCYGLHVVMDALTVGRGVMLLWPFSSERYASPVRLFYGLHWSDGWRSVRHLWTVFTELGYVLVLNILVHVWWRVRSSRRGTAALDALE